MKYDSMYWTDELDAKFIRTRLRLYGEGYVSASIVDAWLIKGKMYGVPRAWAYDRGYQGTDETIFKGYNWPKFNGSYRYNQKECVQKLQAALTVNYGALLESPTGWGKTVVAVNMAAKMKAKTLVLVHKQDLIAQWKDTAKDFFGVSCGMIQQDVWDYDHPITVAMIQTLKSRQFPAGFDQEFGMVIVDEGHHIPCDTFSDVISRLPARYRLGVSATWRRTDKLDDLWKWHLGQIAAKGVRPTLAAKYYQFTVNLGLDDRKFRRGDKINHSAMITAIAEDEVLLDRLVDEIKQARKAGRKILVVTHRLSQVEKFLAKIPDAGVYVGKWRGKILDREALDVAATKQVILATYRKISEGTDIPALDTLVLATPCTDPEQVYGRVNREHPNKKEIVIIDPIVSTSYNYALANKRKRIYEALKIKKG